MDRLFAYGTLQHPRIIQHVLGRVPPFKRARLTDFDRRTIHREDFPGIVPRPGHEVDGRVFEGITEVEWRALDRYESDLYVRQAVEPKLETGGSCTAHAYVIPAEHQHVLSEAPWELTQYRPPSGSP